MSYEDLEKEWVFFNPILVFHKADNDLMLCMWVNAMNNEISWLVINDDERLEFEDFYDALNYYEMIGGCW